MLKINLPKASMMTSPNPVSLVCTKKEDGTTNVATVSWYTYLSFNPSMVGFAMAKTSYSGEMVRKNKKVVLTIPGSELEELVMKCGSTTGRTTNKVSEFNIELESIENCDIKIPTNSKVAIEMTLKDYIEVGDHYLYICDVDNVYGDESKKALFAWNGYSKIKTAE